MKPVRVYGTQWVSHKLSTTKRVLCKFGAYTAHLTTLSEDSSVKPADCAKFKGYLRKWVKAKNYLDCLLTSSHLVPCFQSQCRVMSWISLRLSYLLMTVSETNKLSKST